MLLQQEQIQGASIQSINNTSSVLEWNSVVEIGNTPLTANITITLPSCLNNIGRSIIFKRVDNTSFSITIQAFLGQTLELNSLNLSTQFNAIEITCVSDTKSEQTSNNLNINLLIGATQISDGVNGYVPKPLAGQQFRVLKGDGTFKSISDSQRDFLAQTTAIGTTTIFTAIQSGLYQIQIMGGVSLLGNRNVTTQSIIHTDTSIVRTKSVGAGVNTNNLNNGNTITQVFQCDANTNINYLNTMSGTTGSYNVRILITKLN